MKSNKRDLENRIRWERQQERLRQNINIMKWPNLNLEEDKIEDEGELISKEKNETVSKKLQPQDDELA